MGTPGPQAANSPHLISTKFRPPASPAQIVARSNLLAQLDAGCARRLTLIHGPAGFGKTTIAVLWRERLLQRGAVVAWLSMGREDNELDRCLSYIVEAIRLVEPTVGQGLMALLEAQPEHAAAMVLADLVNGLEASRHQIYLVLDDWHLVTEPAVQEAISFLIDRAPVNFHLVVASRNRPPLPLAKLRVADQLNEIRADELRFSVGESASFLRDVNALSLNDDAVQALWRSTEGWVAALQMALLSLRASDDREHLIRGFSGKHHAIGDYLAENVLDSLPQATLDFLTATSILDRLCADLCAAVSGHANCQAMLEQLEKQDLFIRPLDDERRWYRYHHLFADYLQRRLERDAPQRVATLRRVASDWFAQQGLTDEAVTHALAAGDTERAIDLVETDAMRLVEHSAMASLLGLVHKLPPARLRERTPLQLAIAWGNCLIHRPSEAGAALAWVESSLRSRHLPGDDALFAEAQVVQACIHIYADRLDGVEEKVRPCIDHAAAYSPWVVAVASNILSYVLIHRFEYEEAIRLQAWARPFQDCTRGPFAAIYGRCFAGIAAQALGRLDEGATQFRGALRLAHESAGRHSHAARLAEALLGQLLYETNRLDEAERLLEASRTLGLEGGVADFSIATYVCASRLRAEQGDTDEAQRVLDEGAHTAQQLGFERLAAAVLGERVRLNIARGEVEAAAALLAANPASLSDPAHDGVAEQTRELRLIAHCRLQCALGQAAQALPTLRTLLDRAVARRRCGVAVMLRVQLALALADAGESRAAEDSLAQALTEGMAIGMARVYLDEGPRLLKRVGGLRERLRRSADAAGASPLEPLLRRLLGESSAVAAQAVQPGAAAVPPPRPRGSPPAEALKEREFEVLRMLDQGCSNKEIARALTIGLDTVKWYLKSIYAKLGAASRTQALYQARQAGMLRTPPYPGVSGARVPNHPEGR